MSSNRTIPLKPKPRLSGPAAASGKQSLLRISGIAAITVGISFFVIVLPPLLREFTRAGLEGTRFARYYELFLPVLWLLLVAFAISRRGGALSLWGWILAGALAGYLSGVFSTTAFEASHPGGWNLAVRNSLSLEGWMMRLGYPLIALNWLVGILASSLQFALLRWINRERTQ